MTKPINTASIEKATNKSWQQWVKELDESGSRQLSHIDLVRKLHNELDGKLKSHDWWAQSIAVAYEQHVGKRVPGQLANGLFELAVSKTVPQARSKVFIRVVEWFEKRNELNGREPLKPRSTQTPNRSNWRCDFADGSKFAATVEGDDIKSKLVLSHTLVQSEKEADNWKVFWKNVADELTR
ncbi:MAG: hypothetical protein ACR2FM_03590 [Candidatus Saccharimonadales bacterium]